MLRSSGCKTKKAREPLDDCSEQCSKATTGSARKPLFDLVELTPQLIDRRITYYRSDVPRRERAGYLLSEFILLARTPRGSFWEFRTEFTCLGESPLSCQRLDPGNDSESQVFVSELPL